MRSQFLLGLLVASQVACVNLATLQTARVQEGARVDTSVSVQAEPYRRGGAEDGQSEEVLGQVGAASGIRYSGDGDLELGIQVTSSFIVRGHVKYQFVDWGPLAMATGLGVGADLPHTLLWLFQGLTDEESRDRERDEDDRWAGELVFPLMASVHLTDSFAIYGSGRYHLWSFDSENHAIFAATGGMCVGKKWGVCAEVCLFESANSDLDGLLGAASFFFDIHDAYLD